MKKISLFVLLAGVFVITSSVFAGSNDVHKFCFINKTKYAAMTYTVNVKYKDPRTGCIETVALDQNYPKLHLLNINPTGVFDVVSITPSEEKSILKDVKQNTTDSDFTIEISNPDSRIGSGHIIYKIVAGDECQ